MGAVADLVERKPVGGTFRVAFHCGKCKRPYRDLMDCLAHVRAVHGMAVADGGAR